MAYGIFWLGFPVKIDPQAKNIIVSPAQSASTQPHKTLGNHESSELFDSNRLESKTKRVRQQACGSFLEIAHTN